MARTQTRGLVEQAGYALSNPIYNCRDCCEGSVAYH